jgi:hypothetical protein
MIQINGSLIQDRRKENLIERRARSGPASRDLWTVKDVAKFARLSPSKIYRDAEAGLIPCKRWAMGGQGKKAVLRFHPKEIMEWLDAGCPVPKRPKALVEPPKADKILMRKTVGQGDCL